MFPDNLELEAQNFAITRYDFLIVSSRVNASDKCITHRCHGRKQR